MSDTSRHDETVGTLSSALRSFFATDNEYAVLSGVWWRPLHDFPNYVYTFDVLIVPADEKLDWDAAGDCFGPDVQPTTVIDVVSPDGWEDEFYDKPDTLDMTAVYEYCLWDPSADILRPPLHAARKRDEGFGRVRTSLHGVFFSATGFRLDVRGPTFELKPCGTACVEEELFTCERLLAATRERANSDQKAVDGLTAKVKRLRAKLGRVGP